MNVATKKFETFYLVFAITCDMMSIRVYGERQRSPFLLLFIFNFQINELRQMGNLTLKQIRFIEAYAKCGVGVEAARAAGYANPENAASKVMKSAAVKNELDKIRQEAMQNAKISLQRLLEELEEARQLALSKEAAAAMVSASMGKAKLLGLDKPKVEDIDEPPKQEIPQVLVKFVD